MASKRIDTLGRQILDAREDYEKKRKAKVKAEEKKADLERQLYDELTNQNLPSITVDLGGKHGRHSFVRRETIRARVIDKEVARAALAAEGMEEGYIDIELRKGPMNELIKTRLENKQALPDGLDFSETKFIQATKRK